MSETTRLKLCIHSMIEQTPDKGFRVGLCEICGNKPVVYVDGKPEKKESA